MLYQSGEMELLEIVSMCWSVVLIYCIFGTPGDTEDIVEQYSSLKKTLLTPIDWGQTAACYVGVAVASQSQNQDEEHWLY